ncbi:MAG: hypothetical protein JW983_03140 [Elusimicrobia bacterium]|nr:hypothetical protein [Elusimicrobiota bacterium]
MIPLFIIVPLTTAFVISLVGKFYKSMSDILASLACFTLVVLSFEMVYTLNIVDHMPLIYKVGGWVPPIGISMVVDGLTAVILPVVNIVALMAVIFSISYMERYTDKVKYYTLFMLMLAGMNGVVITGDMFNLYVFLEIGAISSYALVAFGTEHEELEASFRYMVLGSVASLFILFAIAIIYSYTSTLNMADISQKLSMGKNSVVIGFVTVLFLMGFGLKSAIIPFHAWLPDAHPSAPAPISAMLSGVLIKSLGIYALVRIMFNVLGVNS